MYKIYVYMYIMYITTINEKRNHKFEREKGRIYGRFWRDEREGRSYVIIL